MNNTLCVFNEIFNQFPKNQKVNCISCSLFKLKKGYKFFNKYIWGLKNVKRVANKLNFYLLLFIDDTIYNDKKIYNAVKRNIYDRKTIIINYSCPKFKNDEGNHRGLFGTLIRFFPMFDFPNNNFNIVFIMDVDYNPENEDYDKKYIVIYQLLKKYNADMLLHRYFGKKTPQWTEKDKPSFMAGTIISQKKIDYHIIVDYLNELLDEKSKLYKKVFKTTKNSLMYQNISYIDPAFNYGVDEYFLSNILYDHLIKNKYNVMYLVVYDIFSYIQVKYNLYKHDKLKDDVEKFIKFISDNKNNNISSNYKYVKSILNNDNINITDEAQHIINKTYSYIKQLNNNKNYSLFSKDEIKYILQHNNTKANKDIIKKDKIIVQLPFNVFPNKTF